MSAPDGARTVIVSSWTDGLFVLEDGDVTHEFAGSMVSCVTANGEGGVFAIVGSHALWERPLGGAWRQVASSDAPLSCCMVLGERVLAGTDDARLLELSGQGWTALPGLDATPGRESWYAGAAMIDGKLMGPPLGIRSVAATCDGGVLLANVHVGGIPRSTDGGASWRATIDIDMDVHQVCAHPSRPGIVAAAAAAGLCVSRDGGATWSVTREGLHAAYCSAVALTENELYVAASTDHFAAEGAVYRRPIDSDQPLEVVDLGLAGRLGGIADTRCIAVHADVLAVVAAGGDLHQSVDGGASWRRRADSLPIPSGVLIC